MERAEIRWYKFQRPDKSRPVLILTRSSALKFFDEATITPITSKVRNIPSEVLLDENEGMKGLCAANPDHIQTVSKNKIGARIATLSNEKNARS